MPKFILEFSIFIVALFAPLFLWMIWEKNPLQKDLELSSQTEIQAKIASPQARNLQDIETHWIKSFVDQLKEKGQFPQQIQGSFYPDAPITRIQILQWLHELDAQSTMENFSEERIALVELSLEEMLDIEALAEEKKILRKALLEGWIQSPENKEIRPFDLATRAEALSMIIAFSDQKTLSSVIPNFKDVAPYEDWFASMTALALREGWSDQETFDPHRPITRAEFFKWLALALQS